jgi:hypothetical protein
LDRGGGKFVGDLLKTFAVFKILAQWKMGSGCKT